jgi:hypothetical protein
MIPHSPLTLQESREVAALIEAIKELEVLVVGPEWEYAS